MESNADLIIPANSLLFRQFCEICEKLYNNKKNRPLQETYLTEFISAFKITAAQATGAKKDCTFFPILRLLLPNLDRERAAYNLKDTKLGQLYVKILSLHKTSLDARKLLNFRSMPGNQYGSDFASIAYFVLQSRGSRSGSMTIGDINEQLDKVANAEAGTKAQIQDEVFTQVLLNTTPLEQKWWIRIILKDMKLGMGKERILACFHPDAPEHYEMCQSLLKVCEELGDGDNRPAELGVQLFCAISPMLSERLDVVHIGRLPIDKVYQIEAKFDGERFQIHMLDGVFGYFSRRGHLYTEQYGKTYDSDGLLTPHLRGRFDPEVHSFILDGEMMGWHKEKQCFGSKGMSFDVKKITANSKFRPCFCPFDLLYYNGRSLVGTGEGALPLAQRLQLLDRLFSDEPGVIMHSKRTVISNREEILTALNKAIDDAEEGIIVKETNSYYIANRRNAGWYKVKPEYTEGAMVDLDLMVVGADCAENRGQGLVNSFFLALAVDPDTPGEMPKRWVSLGRVATGLTFDEREQLCMKLGQHWQQLDKHPPPPCLEWTRDKPEMWINPDNSIILQVKASELIRSAHFAAGYTLRFPRIMKVRDDKPLKDAMTVEQFATLVQGKAVEKLTSGNINAKDLNLDGRPRRKRTAKVIEVAESFRPAVTAKPEESTSMALRGRKLCILSGDEISSKVDLETIVVSHGGTVVQHSGSDTWCAIAGNITPKVQNTLDAENVDVVQASWLRTLQSSDECCPLPIPFDFISITRKTQMALARHFDIYGDSYTREVDEATLKRCFEKIDRDGNQIYLTYDEIIDLDKIIFEDGNPFSFLRKCHVYIPEYCKRLSINAKMYGAKLCSLDSPLLTHVVVPKDLVDGVNKLKEQAPSATFIPSSWLELCFEERRKVSESNYEL